MKDEISIKLKLRTSDQTVASKLEKEKKASKTSSDDVINKLEKLAQLKEKGVITEEDFEAQKQKLLEQL